MRTPALFAVAALAVIGFAASHSLSKEGDNLDVKDFLKAAGQQPAPKSPSGAED